MIIQYVLSVVFFLGLATYTYRSFRLLFSSPILHFLYVAISVVSGMLILYIFYVGREKRMDLWNTYPWMRWVMLGIFSFWIAQVVGAAVMLVDDARAGLVYAIQKISTTCAPKSRASSSAIAPVFSRSVFLQWGAFGLGSLVFASLWWGVSNRFHFKKRHVRIKLQGLSAAWKGYKIVQLSDIHSGSFRRKDADKVRRGVQMVAEECPDVILFTGDLVNNTTEEMEAWTSIFAELKAPDGVFSVLGNHDYGDYHLWQSAEAKRHNLEALHRLQQAMGWTILDNASVALRRKGASDSLTLVGVENWSARSSFPKYGKLQEALKGLSEQEVKILMSHDPSHWEAEVLGKQPSIQLTLSGHTHGMQFGVETPFFKWSPIQWVYQQWAGLYQEQGQMLYVNRGFGFLGYPGRVGILPEITVIELV